MPSWNKVAIELLRDRLSDMKEWNERIKQRIDETNDVLCRMERINDVVSHIACFVVED